MPNPRGYLNLMAIIQKFIDQSLSTNVPYKPWEFPLGQLPMKEVIKDMMYAYKIGLKTLYYQETKDSIDAEEVEDDSCGSGACKL